MKESKENEEAKEKEKEEQGEQKEHKKSEREIQISKENSKISQRIMVEETRIKGKKAEIMDSIKNKSTLNNESKEGFERSVKIRTKTKYYRKHCRLEIPFCEEQDPKSYNINEPYGYIEIRFNCEKDKQEEYFRNKNLKIELDK